MKKTFFAFLLAALTLSSLFSLETQFSGSLSAEIGRPLPNVEHDDIFTQSTVKASGEVYVYASKDVTFCGKCQAIYDRLAYQSDVFDASTDDGKFGLVLKEAWFDFTSDWWALRVGRQINSWGKADVISVLDVLCPKNYTTLPLLNTSDAYLGIDAARLSANYDVYSVDFYWIPFVRSSVLPLSKKHPVRKIIDEELADDLNEYVQIGKVGEIEPSVDNCEYGFKASAYWKYADVSIYGFYGWDRVPQEYVFNGVLPKIVDFPHNRTKMLGADASIPVKDFVVRLEGAYFFDSTLMPTLDLSSSEIIKTLIYEPEKFHAEKRDLASGVFGLDWMPGSWIFSAQYGANLVLGDVKGLACDKYEHLATLAVSKRLFRDTLVLGAAGILYFKDWNNAFILNASYNASDDFVLSLSGFYYNILTELPELPLFEDYTHWGGITAGIKYSF